MPNPNSELPDAIQSAANDFWGKLPSFTPEALLAQQGIALDSLRVRMDAFKYLSNKSADVTGSAMQNNAVKLHETMFSQNHLVAAAMLMQEVRKVCKHVIFKGAQQDPISWPSLGVVWQSTIDNDDWDLLELAVDKAAKKQGIPRPDIEPLDIAIEVRKELVHTISYYVLDPAWQSTLHIEKHANQLTDELILYLEAAHLENQQLSFEDASNKALDFLSAKLPSQFVDKLLAPQRQIVDSIVSNAQLSEVKLMGKMMPQKGGKDLPPQ